MRKLQEIQGFIFNDFEKLAYYDRHHYQSIRLGSQINGILGPRGTGKTTFLLKKALETGAKEGRALYVSIDNIFFLDNKLFDLCEWIYTSTDITCLYIDEIHKYKHWKQELKNIYDTFKNLNVVFTGSSMIDIISGQYDLSRRVSLYPMVGLSFREYLEFNYNIVVENYSIDEIVQNHTDICQSLGITKIAKYFNEYIQQGYYPFVKNIPFERERFQGIENIIQKTIYEDIATLHNLKTPSLLVIENIFKYIIGSAVGKLSINKIANSLQKDYSDINKYLSYLESAGLIHLMKLKKGGKELLKPPSKILPDNSNMIYAFYLPQTQDNLIGKVRETFVVNQLKNAGHQVYYSHVGDYQVDRYTFEIGGKNKTTKQIKNIKDAYVLADNIMIGNEQIIPLYLVGLLY